MYKLKIYLGDNNMKVSKLFLLGVLPFTLALSSCGQTEPPKENKLHEAYEFSRIETSNGEGTDVVLNQYSNSYMEFDRGVLDSIGDEYYRFTYSISFDYGGTSFEQVYEEFGNFNGPGYVQGHFYFSVSHKFTLIDGVYSSATSANRLAYELVGDSLRVKVINGEFVLGAFLMESVDKRVPSFMSDYNFFVNINLNDTYYSQEYLTKYIGSKAYVNDNNEFYFTYRQGKNICKEVGVITDNVLNPDRGSEEPPIYEIQITKLYKYLNDVKVSEETPVSNIGITTHIDDIGRKSLDVFVDFNTETEVSLSYRENRTVIPPKPERI